MHQSISYEDARRLAHSGSVKERRAIAEHRETPPEILYFLADDPDAGIRQCIAANATTPHQADFNLAQDADDDVRCVLASKISHLFPKTSRAEQDTMRRAVMDVMEVLASDEASRVRAVVADTLKDAPDIPHHLIVQLANDPDLQVCLPVLEYSPILTNEDLLALIKSAPVQGALGAIARRQSVDEDVSDEIADTRDREAIADLLANPSAQVREETLDMLIDMAPDIEPWHAPLVNRPALPPGPAQRIAGFVAKSLLDKLGSRIDLPAETVTAVQAAVKCRLDAVSPPPGAAAHPLSAKEAASQRRALALFDSGELDNRSIRLAIAKSDRRFVQTALELRSGLTARTVEQIFKARSGQAVVSLCWKAGLDMQMAMQVQFTVLKFAPGDVMRSPNLDTFPMSPEDMDDKLAHFAGLGAEPAVATTH
ncbi:MAG: DUF2336 domain-containing protein [Proteobacteria bacterium]|nr:DUF2336 domain-containing protein [Pseudomonadota bacterium]